MREGLVRTAATLARLEAGITRGDGIRVAPARASSLNVARVMRGNRQQGQSRKSLFAPRGRDAACASERASLYGRPSVLCALTLCSLAGGSPCLWMAASGIAARPRGGKPTSSAYRSQKLYRNQQLD
jgi:hypothetical protein